MDRSDRLNRLLQILHARPMTPVEELAARLGVSDRTIYRDLESLREGKGVPRKARLGYAVELDAPERVLDLEPAELEALAFGVRAAGSWGDPALAAAAESLVAKVAAALSAEATRALVSPAATSKARHGFRRVAGLGKLRQALSERRKLYFTYADTDGSGERRERVVRPRSLVFRGDHWLTAREDRRGA
jgi:predicted DNA-binding transcriptional regulator YafY